MSGLLFDDGTIVKDLASNDLDELGAAVIRFIRPDGVSYSICHRLKAYQFPELIGAR